MVESIGTEESYELEFNKLSRRIFISTGLDLPDVQPTLRLWQMIGVRTRLFSLTVRGNTIDFMVTRLDHRSFRFYKAKHVNPKSAFYKPIKLEWGVDIGKRSYSIHYKQDL